jgi:hypothetical protein
VRAFPLARVVTVAAALVLSTAAPALAELRYAVPIGGSASDPTCDAAHPCDVYHAMSVAASGDTVLLAAGDYALNGEPLFVPPGVDAIGPSTPRPRLIGGSATAIIVGQTEATPASLGHV